VIGHEPVGVIAELGEASPVTRSATACWSARSRRAASAARASPATPRSAGTASGYEAIGGWRMGNTIHGAQAEYVRIPYAQANLAQDSRRV
jgi:threonine dehydrogenase-like Zn-dependent dehydrogenase